MKRLHGMSMRETVTKRNRKIEIHRIAIDLVMIRIGFIPHHTDHSFRWYGTGLTLSSGLDDPKEVETYLFNAIETRQKQNSSHVAWDLQQPIGEIWNKLMAKRIEQLTHYYRFHTVDSPSPDANTPPIIKSLLSIGLPKK